jgi:hypothetical protein
LASLSSRFRMFSTNFGPGDKMRSFIQRANPVRARGARVLGG